MPFSVADQPISGDSFLDLGAVHNLLFWSVWITDYGTDAHEVEPPSGYFYRLGWIATGDRFGVGTVGEQWYWREPTRLAFDGNLWTPNATMLVGGPSLTQLASGIRWHLSAGTAGYLFALADT